MARKKLSLRRKVASGNSRCVLFLELDSAVATEDDVAKPVWVQIAAAGDYKGYEGGAFKFDRSVFDTIIANFRAHPAYQSGGAKDVIPWDFHHASEFSPASGSIPVDGVPAQGWVRELEVRQGAKGDELWALTRWLEPARSYIKDGKYKWASVTVYFGTKDPVSGEDRGANLVSVALTNQPFIEGMTELIAASRGVQPVGQPDEVRAMYSESLGVYYEQAKDAVDALAQLRKVFGLSGTAGAAEVMTEITKLMQWSMGGGAPLGVDVGSMVGCMRHIFGLPALSTNEEVFAEASKLIQALLEQETESAGATPGSVATENRNMQLVAILASLFGCIATEQAVREHVESLHTFRLSLAKKLGLSPNIAYAALLEASDGADVRAKLGALLKAVGVENSDEAVTRVAEMMAKAQQLETLMPELSSLREQAMKTEEDAATKDVEEAMASYNLPDAVKDALVLMRKGKDGKKIFAEKFPKKTAEQVAAEAAAVGTPASGLPALLAHTIASTPKGGERRVVADSDGRVTLERLGAGPASGAGNQANQPVVINLSTYSGRNKTERMIAYVRAQMGADGPRAEYPVVFNKALELLHSPKIRVVDDAA